MLQLQFVTNHFLRRRGTTRWHRNQQPWYRIFVIILSPSRKTMG